MQNPIQPAQIQWRKDDNGNTVPVSKNFGDVYFSIVDGLNESRYVFIEHNQLPQRFANLKDYQTFCIAELGFGTGLNFFATWQLWNKIKKEAKAHHTHLHFISFEKFPLSKADLQKALTSWTKKEPELAPLIKKLIVAYPTLIEGCHRLNFTTDSLTLDLWLGDANDNLAKLSSDEDKNSTPPNAPTAKIDAWFLDGFAPSCNKSLWAEQIFTQIGRLSKPTTTAATFSCAGVVKRGFKNIGFDIAKVKGFGRKREMLTAKFIQSTSQPTLIQHTTNTQKAKTALVIGAGVSGLMTARALTNRGIQVTLVDKIAPLAGASGNPRGLLAPKMTPIHHVAEHLHSIGYLYSSRLYQAMNLTAQPPVFEAIGVLDLLAKANISAEQINAYPHDFAHVLAYDEAQHYTGIEGQDLSINQFLPQGGLVNPQALASQVLAHPLITFQQATVLSVTESVDIASAHCTINHKNTNLQADNIIICAADKSCQIDKRIFDFRKIRGQVSWFSPTDEQLKKLPKHPLKYGGYCTPFIPQTGDDKNNNVTVGTPTLLMGASFIRNDSNTNMRDEEHTINLQKLINAIPKLANVITNTEGWQARAGIRSQTPDYHPLVGLLANSKRIWTLSGMGAKGYAYTPICSEALVDMLMGTIPPLSAQLMAKLSPNRQRLQQPLT